MDRIIKLGFEEYSGDKLSVELSKHNTSNELIFRTTNESGKLTNFISLDLKQLKRLIRFIEKYND